MTETSNNYPILIPENQQAMSDKEWHLWDEGLATYGAMIIKELKTIPRKCSRHLLDEISKNNQP
jgi:hypothetical protein